MDKISKALTKFSQKERRRVKEILEKIAAADTRGLNVAKLKGREDIFRARKGDMRIIYRRDNDGKIFVLAIERKNGQTYRGI